MHRSKSFWMGVGLAGVAWFWRRQLRPLAVKGAKGGILIAEGIKDNIKAMQDVFFDLKQDAQLKRIRDEVQSEEGHNSKIKGDKD